VVALLCLQVTDESGTVLVVAKDSPRESSSNIPHRLSGEPRSLRQAPGSRQTGGRHVSI